MENLTSIFFRLKSPASFALLWLHWRFSFYRRFVHVCTMFLDSIRFPWGKADPLFCFYRRQVCCISFCEQEKNYGASKMALWTFLGWFLFFFTSMALSSPLEKGTLGPQESGDPEQIKAALEEAKRAGADEASVARAVGIFRCGWSHPVRLMSMLLWLNWSEKRVILDILIPILKLS